MKEGYEKLVSDIKDKVRRLRFEEPNTVISCLNELKKLAKKNNDELNMAFAYTYIGDAYLTLGDLGQCYDNVLEALKILKDKKIFEIESTCYNLIGIYYNYIDDLVLSIEYFYKALVCAKQNDDFIMQGNIYNNFGSMYMSVKNFEKAVKCFEEAYNIYILHKNEDIRYNSEITRYHMNMVMCCIETDRLEEAVLHLEYVEQNIDKDMLIQYGIGVDLLKIKLSYKLGNIEEVRKSISYAIMHHAKDYSKVEFILSFVEIAKLCGKVGMIKEGKEILEKLEKYFKTDAAKRKLIVESYIEIYEESGDIDNYLEYFEEYYNAYIQLDEEGITKKVTSIDNRMKLFYENIKYYRFVNKNSELKELSERDELTGAYNRYAFRRIGGEILRRSIQNETNIILYEMDIDYFKSYNDSYGHLAGDDCLKIVVDTVNETIKDEAALFRYGGDEFFLLGTDISEEKAQRLAYDICNAVKNKNLKFEHNPEGVVTISIGMVVYVPKYDVSMSEIVHYADEALYKQKKRKRGSYCMYNFNDK